MTKWPITLTPAELMQAALAGICRHVAAVRDGRAVRPGTDPDKVWQIHIEGACGELAVAKAWGVYWAATVDTFKAGGDVMRVQVRTRSKGWYELNVREDDDDGKVFVLVTGRAPDYVVHGWMLAGEAKRHPEWRQGHGGREVAWFVPQDALKPMTLLPEDAFET